eukprot:5051847-Prymnesium_polylepis.2
MLAHVTATAPNAAQAHAAAASAALLGTPSSHHHAVPCVAPEPVSRIAPLALVSRIAARAVAACAAARSSSERMGGRTRRGPACWSGTKASGATRPYQ